MKKYKYSKISYAVQLIFLLLLTFGLLFVSLLSNKGDFIVKVGGLVLLILIYIPFMVSVFKREIVLEQKCVNFFSFYVNNKASDFSVLYEDILKIEAKKTLIPKRISIKLTIASRQTPVFIEYNMVNHKELYSELIKNTVESNSKVFVDSSILDYIKN